MVAAAATVVSMLDTQSDKKRKPAACTKQCCSSPTDVTPASRQPLCSVVVGKREDVFCEVVLYFVVFFQLIA